MSEQIRSMCKSLRLAYVSEIYESIPFESPSQFLEELFKEEFRLRDQAKVQRLIKNAKFLDSKSLSNYEWTERIRFPTQIDKDGLMSLDFIKQKQNVVLIGAPGTGNYEKTLFMERYLY
ncbi:ATP-binding protein [Bacillus nitroreducens]